MDKIYSWFKDVTGTGYEEVGTEDKVFFWFCVLLALVAAVLLIAFVVWIIDNATSYKVQAQGVILDKLHVPSTESTGYGFGVSGQGRPVSVITSSGSPEDWDIVVREAGSGEVHKISVPMQYLYDSKPGQTVCFTKKYGGLTKDLLSVTLA